MSSYGAAAVSPRRFTRCGTDLSDPCDDNDIDTTEQWEVSSDGKTLTQTIDLGGQFGVQQVKLVYHRAA
jgi:hypothetical protein